MDQHPGHFLATSRDAFQAQITHWLHLYLHVLQLERFSACSFADFAEKLAVKPSFHSLRNKTLRCIPGLNGSIHIEIKRSRTKS